jgi:hypothetical protein
MLIVFNLTWCFIYSLGVFNIENPSFSANSSEEVLEKTTGIKGGMESVFKFATTGLFPIGALAVVVTGTALGMMLKSPVPLGICLFGLVFWGSYWATYNIINLGGFVPMEFMMIATGGVVFLFVASVVGMLTGSG